MKFLIVEDHAIVRQGIMRLLQDVLDEPLQFDEASDGYQAITLTEAFDYDLVLLDLSLPDQNGLDVLKLLKKKNSKLPVIILSTYPEDQYAVRALRAGASAYVNKGSGSTILQNAIDIALTGKRYVPPSQMEMLVDAISEKNEGTPLLDQLSDREYQVICMMTSGKTITEVARELSLSVKTIGTYRARILEKLHLNNTADIISYGTRNNLAL
jgi:two-component system invasion response regulator UvrY